MTTNDCIKQLHAALVHKAKEKCAVEGNNKTALEIGGKIAEYGAAWSSSFGNDGKLDDDEERDICSRFNALIDTYVPSKDGVIVDKAWNGFSLFFVNVFKGVKNYLNNWFNLRLAFVLCLLSSVLLTGCRAFYENAGSRTIVGSVTSPIEVTEPTSACTVRALYAMDGADVYTAKDALVKIVYRNAYTNDYFFIVKTQGQQDLSVEIEPLATDTPTNDCAAASMPQ